MSRETVDTQRLHTLGAHSCQVLLHKRILSRISIGGRGFIDDEPGEVLVDRKEGSCACSVHESQLEVKSVEHHGAVGSRH